MWAHIKLSLAFCSEPNPYSLRDFQPSTISGSCWFFPSLRNGGQLWQGARSISAVWSLRGAKLDEAKGMLEFRTMAISSFGSIVTDHSNLQNLENQMANEQSEVSLDTSRQTYPGVPGRYGHVPYHPGFAPPGWLTSCCGSNELLF